MPIIIRETTIRANLSNEGTAATPEKSQGIRTTNPDAAAIMEEHVQKLLFRKLKARDER